MNNPAIKLIAPGDRRNMDEAGIMEGVRGNGLVLGSSRKRYTLLQQSGSRDLITAVESINALGQALPPLCIFQGKWVQRQWFPPEVEPYKEWFFTASATGWTNDEIALAWLDLIFIPLTKPETKRPRLLILDGHGSHTTDEFMIRCFQNDIFLLFLPSHSSHVLQPLDLSVFSPIKRAYRDELAKKDILIDSSPISKMTFLECYYKARLVGLTAMNIRSGWKASGLWPVNVAKPLMSPYVLQPLIGPFRAPSPPSTPPRAGMKRKDDHGHYILTPKGSHQVRKIIRDFIDDKQIDPPMRLLFRKICKGLDEQQVKISINTAKITQLERQNEMLRPKKRARLLPNPNSKFATVEQLAEQADRYTAIPDEIEAPDELENYIFEELCFVWQLE
uniref:DDE-1 domain-containing protein n=1 Tax=Bionectria ochroleuca TaxID=29856 RepID=A0A8H7K8J1_BIOOC